MSAIQIQNVSFGYVAEKKALDNVSLEILHGKTFGLLGPNGGGKTTLFKILSSLIRHFDGEVWIDGQKLKDNYANVLSKLGVVFQSPSLDKKLTVEENLMYQGQLHGLSSNEIKVRMSELLVKLSIEDRRQDFVSTLSGGLARRVEIVKSVLHRPSILILDEPSTGLDIAVRMDLWNLLQQIQREQGITIVLTTHFIEEADRCDQIALLNQGKIIAQGSPADLKSKLSFKLFEVRPKNLEETKNILENQFRVTTTTHHGVLQFKTDPTIAKNIANEISNQVIELNYRDPSLEDVFMQHAGRKIMQGGPSA